MNHQEITSKWKGKNVNEKGYRPECVAWVKKYCEERGYPIKSFGGSAYKGWFTGSPFNSSWLRIEKTRFNYPPMGAVVFWNENRCKNGHVSIANGYCNPLLLRHVDQNGTGKYDVIQSRWNNYDNVTGWYVKK